MPAYMKFVDNDAAEWPFDLERLPLITRRPTHVRRGDQAGSRRRVDVTLTGYFTGETPAALRARYDSLVAFLSNNRVIFQFNDGTNTIVNNPVYLTGISEPTQTHRYHLEYQVDFYYHTPVNSHAADPIKCSYLSDNGTYTFAVTPQWGFVEQPDRSEPLGKMVLPSNFDKGSVVGVQLTGEVCATSMSALEAERVNMFNIFRKDGILNYGDFSAAVRVGRKQIPLVTPNEYFEYAIDFVYFLPGLLEFKATRNISRLHLSPTIRENPACGSIPYVVTGATQGQTIDYFATAKGTSIESIRSALATELALLVYANGYEVPGGTEEWNEDPPGVAVRFSRYYPIPVIANLGDF